MLLLKFRLLRLDLCLLLLYFLLLRLCLLLHRGNSGLNILGRLQAGALEFNNVGHDLVLRVVGSCTW